MARTLSPTTATATPCPGAKRPAPPPVAAWRPLSYPRLPGVTRAKRVRGQDPVTPDVHAPISKRAFDGRVRVWRRALHRWDPHGADPDADAEGLDGPTAGDNVTSGDAADPSEQGTGAGPEAAVEGAALGGWSVDPELAALLRDDP
jgi:hypothetical protein